MRTITSRITELGLELAFELPRTQRPGEWLVLRAADPERGLLPGADGFRDAAGAFRTVGGVHGRSGRVFVPNGALHAQGDPVFVAGLADERDAVDVATVFRVPWSGHRRAFDPIVPDLPLIGLALHVAYADGHVTQGTIGHLQDAFPHGRGDRLRELALLGPPATVEDCAAAWVRLRPTASVDALFDVLFEVARADRPMSQARARVLLAAVEAVSPGSSGAVRDRVDDAVLRGRREGMDARSGIDRLSVVPGAVGAGVGTIPRPPGAPDPICFGLLERGPWEPVTLLDPETLEPVEARESSQRPLARVGRAQRDARRHDDIPAHTPLQDGPVAFLEVITRATRLSLWPGPTLLPILLAHAAVPLFGSLLCFPFGSLLVTLAYGPLALASVASVLLAVVDRRSVPRAVIAPYTEPYLEVWTTGAPLLVVYMLPALAVLGTVISRFGSGEPFPFLPFELVQLVGRPLTFVWMIGVLATFDGGNNAVRGLVRTMSLLRRDGVEIGKLAVVFLGLGAICDLPIFAYAVSHLHDGREAAVAAMGPLVALLSLVGSVLSYWALVVAAVTYRAGTMRRVDGRRHAA